ncbi:MAG TPA: hypothetical protein VMV45_12430 [Casimicrobiaceae bacterium]|nr:hypothetical protein [Casimicrobiaceae bacterium]
MESVQDPRSLRRSQPLEQVLPATLRWIGTLPPEVRPAALVRQFPRIANALAHVRHDESSWRDYLDELLVDRRGNRRGFPADVHIELISLRDYFAGRYPASP